MNEQRLQGIEERANAATPGPWETDTGGDVFTISREHKFDLHDICERPHCHIRDENLPQQFATMDFIAHAREDVPALVAEVRALRAELAAEKASHDNCRAYWVKTSMGVAQDADAEINALRAELAELKNPRAGTCPHMEACGYNVLKVELARKDEEIRVLEEIIEAEATMQELRQERALAQMCLKPTFDENNALRRWSEKLEAARAHLAELREGLTP